MAREPLVGVARRVVVEGVVGRVLVLAVWLLVVEDAEYQFPQLSGVLLDRFFEPSGYSPGGVAIRAASKSR